MSALNHLCEEYKVCDNTYVEECDYCKKSLRCKDWWIEDRGDTYCKKCFFKVWFNFTSVSEKAEYTIFQIIEQNKN